MNEDVTISQLSRLTRDPLHERVYLEIKKSLMAGRLKPGQRLTVRALARSLGTSEMPVRAALSRLVAERALALLQNGSVIVPLMTRARFAEIMDLRILLEGVSAERATSRIKKRELKRLAQLTTDLAKAAKAGNTERYLQKNQDFKFTVYTAADSPVLLNLIETLWLQVGPFLRYLSKDIRFQLEIDCYDDALSALRRRDGYAVRRAFERDIAGGSAFLLKVADFAEEENLPDLKDVSGLS